MKITHQPTHVPGYAVACTVSVKDDNGKEMALFNAVDTPDGLQRIDHLCNRVGSPASGEDLDARVQVLGSDAITAA